MAQKPIMRYGQFTPTGVDQSAAQQMRALAGLGETVARAGIKIGEAAATARAPEKAKKAIDEATTVDPVTGEVTREKIKMKSGLGWGDAAYNEQIAVHD